MVRHVTRSILWVCLWTTVALAGRETVQGHAEDDPRTILDQLHRRLDSIVNYQCTQLMVAPPRHQRGPAPSAPAHADKKELAYNCQGYGRVREIHNDLSAASYIWDGTRAIEIRERVRPNGTVVHSKSIVPGRHYQVEQNNAPWRYLGGTLVQTLTKALDQGTDIHVTRTDEGLCRVDINYPYGSTDSTVLDPARGYLPIVHRVITQGRERIHEEIDFKEVNPGVWFPVAVWMQSRRDTAPSSAPPTPQRRFSDIKINDPDFDRLLDPALPPGSTVADEIQRTRYVVGSRRTANRQGNAAPATPSDPDNWREAFEAAYRLDADEALKHVISPFPPARRQFIINHESPQALGPESAQLDRIYIFQWDGRPRPKMCFAGMGFLRLSDILQHVVGLDIAAYNDPEEILDLRLTGDWIVRPNVSTETCLNDLARIVHDETGLNIGFERQRVDTQVVKVTGTFAYHALPGALRDCDVQLFAERSVDERRTYCGGGSGTLPQMLRHLTNRIGKRFMDMTHSSQVRLSWSDYRSSRLAPYDGPRDMYREALAQLLENVGQQTGLTFTLQRCKIDGWLVTVAP